MGSLGGVLKLLIRSFEWRKGRNGKGFCFSCFSFFLLFFYMDIHDDEYRTGLEGMIFQKYFYSIGIISLKYFYGKNFG